MEAIDSVKAYLTPRLDGLVSYLSESGQADAHRFFSRMQQNLLVLEQEEELLELFIQLSMTAFQGFQLDPVAASIVDDILAFAEQTSHTFSADRGSVN
jgi:hypothetical protein